MKRVLCVLVLSLLSPIVVFGLYPSLLNDDVLGLIVFKAEIQDPYGKLESWNEEDDSPCKWNGVKCNPRSNRISEINLDGFSLSGKIGRGLLELQSLRKLSLAMNNFSGELSVSLTQLSSLRTIDLSGNGLSGSIPGDLFQECGVLRSISLANNKFSGRIPESFGSCVSLASLNLSSNQFSGQLPRAIWSLNSLRYLDLSDNLLGGEIPKGIEGLSNLTWISLQKNQFKGEVPDGIGNCWLLRSIDLSQNSLSGELPNTMQKLQLLRVLNISKNSISGNLPESITSCTNLLALDASHNSLTGEIPASIGNCLSLVSLILSHNDLAGTLPSSLAKLAVIRHVDLSFNKLTGSLPKELANLTHLLSFNISHNRLQGELPGGGFFNTISPSSVSNNPLLCGAAVNRSCASVLPKPIVMDPASNASSTPDSIPRAKKKILSLSALIAIIAAAIIVLGMITISVVNLSVRSATSRSAADPTFSGEDDFSYSPASTDAKNSGKLVMFSSGEPDFNTGSHALLNKDCELGRGGFGAVYKTVLNDGRPVAIKKLTVSSLVKSREEFERVVKKLGKASNHPNLVSLQGYYWTPSLQLLIYEFVSGGNLYKILHEEESGKNLSWNQRFNIILGTARSLAHLHQKNIIHYNIKSSNILIDNSGVPKVGDFGLARLLPMLDRYVLSSKIQSALGYMAPEFACKTVKITEKCDVYGFGILVLETITGKTPVEYMEDDVVVLCDVVRAALEEGRLEECIHTTGLNGNFPAEEAIPIIKLALICTSQVPSNRPYMSEVVSILEMIRSPCESHDDELV